MSTGSGKYNMVLTRVFDVPVKQVWKAWSDPGLVMRWWGPNDFTAPVARMDFREGGTSLVCMRAPQEFGGQDLYNSWTYQRIVPLQRIEFVQHFTDQDGNPINPTEVGLPAEIPFEVPHVITFKALSGEKTEVTVTEYGYPAEQIVEISRAGMDQCLDKMAVLWASGSTSKVTSKDGTTIAFDQLGKGPAIILVVGAFNDRATGAPLARFLEQHFTVFNYDRRGRGESGGTAPYAIEREFEDLDALIAQAGGSACVFGYSSGATLALRAAAHGLAISQLALYEPPPTGAKAGELAPQLTELITAGRRGDAVELFQIEAVGIPPAIVAQMRNAPFRPALEKMAHTLVYESIILRPLPTGLIASVRVPTLVIDGEESHEVMRHTAQSLARDLPDGRYRTLKGQGHDIVPAVVGPALEEFFL